MARTVMEVKSKPDLFGHAIFEPRCLTNTIFLLIRHLDSRLSSLAHIARQPIAATLIAFATEGIRKIVKDRARLQDGSGRTRERIKSGLQWHLGAFGSDAPQTAHIIARVSLLSIYISFLRRTMSGENSTPRYAPHRSSTRSPAGGSEAKVRGQTKRAVLTRLLPATLAALMKGDMVCIVHAVNYGCAAVQLYPPSPGRVPIHNDHTRHAAERTACAVFMDSAQAKALALALPVPSSIPPRAAVCAED
ncbi:hypothetical protein C8R47DRAFT_1080034 [Mycena vitilis]|nr:hypothetical protein C8R47DRAFT_1080034 [Mycena vitilis]